MQDNPIRNYPIICNCRNAVDLASERDVPDISSSTLNKIALVQRKTIKEGDSL